MEFCQGKLDFFKFINRVEDFFVKVEQGNAISIQKKEHLSSIFDPLGNPERNLLGVVDRPISLYHQIREAFAV